MNDRHPKPLSAEQLAAARAPGLFRRLAAAGYDLLLLFGVLVTATALVSIPYQMLTGETLTRGLPRLLLQLYLLAAILGYYLYFWTGGRQSLGMRAWRLRLIRVDGGPLDLASAARRLGWALLALAPAGAGLWWLLFDPRRRAWHDHLSGTFFVMDAKPARSSRPAARKTDA